MTPGFVPILAFGAAALIAVVWMLMSASALKQRAIMCDDCWSDVVHDLGRRHELVPKLVETARPMLSEHVELLDGMLSASQEAQSHRAPPGERGLEESAVSVTLQRLLSLVEQRPMLKQDPGFQRLRKELVDIEDRIQSTRRAYNASVKDVNKRSKSFPVNVIAGSDATRKRETFELLPVGMPSQLGGRS